MIAKVVPAVRLPTTASETYDYNIPETLVPAVQPGAVVIIPFAGRRIPGLVVATAGQADHDKPLKDLVGFAQGLSPLPAYTVDLWKKLAELFATTLPRFAWLALPAVPTRSIQTCCVAPFETEQNKTMAAAGQPGFVYLNDPSDQTTMVKKILAAAKGRQVLVLTPTVDEADAWAKTLGGATVYHSALAVGAKYKIACAAGDGTVRLVIGTKSAVFLPWHDLFAIVIISAGSMSHLQEDSDPRFDARLVAEELAARSGARLVALDSLPPVGLTAAGSNGRWTELNASRAVAATIHDLHDAAKAAKTRVLLSGDLETAIDEAVTAGKRVLIVLNRRGVSTAYVCQDCGTIVICPACDIPLTVHHDRQSCSACERLYPLPDNCNKCGGANLKAIGSGSKTLFDALKKRHPMTAILHVDRDSWKARPDEAQIVVGTTAVFRALSPQFKPFDLAADALLGAGTGKAGIWSVEETARIARALAACLVRDGALHVQTFDQTSPALKALTAPQEFAKTELEERRDFGYPPVQTLITIYGAGVDEDALWKEANNLITNLQSALPLAVCAAPTWSRPKLFRKKYRLTLTLKIPFGQSYAGLARQLPAGFAAEAKML